MSLQLPKEKWNQAILNYLHSRGFKATENAFFSELHSLDEFIFDSQILLDAQGTGLSQNIGQQETANAIVESYNSLVRFTEDSLDLYKSELQGVLYPLFVHTYLDLMSRGYHAEAVKFFDAYKNDYKDEFPSDITQLQSISTPAHVQQNSTSSLFRQNKYTLIMSSYAFELLLSFLMDNHYKTLLKLVNQYLNVKIYSTKPVESMKQEVGIGISGHTSQEIMKVNQGNFYEGKVPPERHYKEIVEKHLAKTTQGGSEVIEHSEVVDLYKKHKASMALDRAPPIDEVVPQPPKTNIDVLKEVDAILDLRHRVAFSEDRKVSSVMYTVHNSFDSLTCMSFSSNMERMALGFEESYLRIFSLTDEPLRTLKGSTEYTAGDFESEDKLTGYEQNGDMSKRLIGHSGPVYDCCFSPDDKYLISGSEDGTARLWGLDTYTNLVVYRGHNYPIWNVDISAQSYYFATGSHDRTARLWSLERTTPVRIFAGHLSDVDCVKFHPNCNYLATGSSDKTIRLWDIHQGKCVRLFTSTYNMNVNGQVFGGHPSKTGTIMALAMSPDGKMLASGGDDGSVVVWELSSGRVVCRFGIDGTLMHGAAKQSGKGHASEYDVSSCFSLDFSKDSGSLAAGFGNGRVVVFNIKLGSSSSKDGGSDKDEAYGEVASVFPTKRTPVHKVQFTNRNLLISGGPFVPYE